MLEEGWLAAALKIGGQGGLMEKVTFEQEMKVEPCGRAFQAGRTASAKALG